VLHGKVEAPKGATRSLRLRIVYPEIELEAEDADTGRIVPI